MFLIGILVFINLIISNISYEVPEAEFDIFESKGFRVSIPQDGNELFAFHGKLNEKVHGLEAGTWSVDVTKAINGRFYYHNYEPNLKIGDVIHYWTYVIRDGLGYRYDDGEFEVKEYSPFDNELDSNKRKKPSTSSALPSPNANSSPSTTPSTIPSCSTPKPPTTIIDEKPSSCFKPSKSVINDLRVACAGDVIFEDDFSGKILDAGKWRMERRFPDGPDDEFNIYLDNTEALSLVNGTAIIKPIILNDVYGDDAISKGLDFAFDCTGEFNTSGCKRAANVDNILPPFITAQFSTINSFKFKYGRVEVRAKLPSGDWVFPQIFLNPVEQEYGERNYESGQLRVVQSLGECKIKNSAIMYSREPFRSAKSCVTRCAKNGDWHNQFHNFTMIWLPDSIKFLADGDELCSVDQGEGLYSILTDGKELPHKEILRRLGDTPFAPFDKDFYITLGYGIGGVNDFAEEGRKPWRNDDSRKLKKFWRNAKKYDWTDEKYEFEIDYIRVYAV